MIGRLLDSDYFWLILSVALLLGSVILTVRIWDWLHPPESTMVSNSETLRNVGLLIGGMLAFVFAGWRARVAGRQANATKLQADTASVQAETTQRSLLNECYQRAVEMLGSTILAVRMGGIYALIHLAEEHPEQYHIQVMEILCAYARNPVGTEEDWVVGYEGTDPTNRLREDLQAVMTYIGNRGSRELIIEQQGDYIANLTGAFLCHLQLEKGNLSSVRLGRANLRSAYLLYADLSGARLDFADLSGSRLAFANLTGSRLLGTDLSSSKTGLANLSNATLDGANLSNADLNSATFTGASFMSTNLSGADFSHDGQGPAIGLTQSQLDCAYRSTGAPPSLARVVDIDTGKPLEWQRPLGFVA